METVPRLLGKEPDDRTDCKKADGRDREEKAGAPRSRNDEPSTVLRGQTCTGRAGPCEVQLDGRQHRPHKDGHEQRRTGDHRAGSEHQPDEAITIV